MSKISYAPVLEMIRNGKPRSEVIAHIKEKYFVGDSRAGEIYRTEYAKTEKLEFSDKFTYNKETDKYVIPLKCRRDPLVISGARHRAICRDYSSWNGDLTANEVCIKFSLTPEIFSEYRRIFNLTKDREPLSAEEVWDNSEDDSVESILEQKRYSIYQKFEKADWHETQKDADKWRAFSSGVLDVVKLTLDEWVPPRPCQVKVPKVAKGAAHTFIVGANDWHIGEKYSSEEGFRGKDFNSSIAASLIDGYASQIGGTVNSRNYKFSECLVILNGDILNSFSHGTTVKGTVLHNDAINEEMFRLALDCVSRFIERMAAIFPKVSVWTLPGNHDGPLLSILGMAIQAYFRKTPSVTINVSTSWAEVIRVGDVGVLMTHGGAAFVKSSLPQSSLKLKSYLQDMWSVKSDQLQGVSQKIVISGHFHRFWQQDMGHFDFYCFGGLPLGDSYSDALNLTSKPRQNCLILDGRHVVESLHFYFD